MSNLAGLDRTIPLYVVSQGQWTYWPGTELVLFLISIDTENLWREAPGSSQGSDSTRGFLKLAHG